MEKEQIPVKKKEATNDRPPQSLFNVPKELERLREDVFHKADDGDELPFDVPRD